MRFSPLLLSLTLLSAAPGCRCAVQSPAGAADAARPPHAGPAGARHEPPEALPQCPAGDGDFLERAQAFYDLSMFGEALSCAAQAAGAEPENPDAHAERAWALSALGNFDGARTAYARAMALDADHRDALQGAAELYVSRMPFSRENSELGLAYALRGRAGAEAAKDLELAARFASIAATALNDLGRAREAVALAESALAAKVDVENARYEKASALWELCLFAEARQEFQALVGVEERAAHAHHYLGLIAERDKDAATSEREFAQARRLDPSAFPAEVAISPEDFAALVARTAAALPADMRQDLEGIPVSTQDIPDFDDLIVPDPPLSPTIVGLFRGPSLGEACTGEETPCRSIVLYRKNMVRAVKDRAELERQIEVTLLHEVGHLRGEDDVQLVARGLE